MQVSGTESWGKRKSYESATFFVFVKNFVILDNVKPVSDEDVRVMNSVATGKLGGHTVVTPQRASVNCLI